MDTADKKDAAVEEHLEDIAATSSVNNNDNKSAVSVSVELAECASAAAQLSAIRDPAEMGSKLSDLIQQTQQLYVTLCQVATAQQQAPGSTMPPMNGGDGKAPQHWKNPQLFKTSICEHWRTTGRCRFGARCWYAHGSYELRYVPRLEKRQPSQASTSQERKRDKLPRTSPVPASQIPSLLSLPAHAPFVPLGAMQPQFNNSYAAAALPSSMSSLSTNQSIDGMQCPAYQRRAPTQRQPSQQHFAANQHMLYADPQEWCYLVPRSSSTSLAESSLAPGMPYAAQAPTTPPHEIGDQEEPAAPQAHNHFQKSFRMFGESYPLRALDLA